jgi:hypothetical protein
MATVAAPLLAEAQAMPAAPERILSDPTYLPLKGQIYGDTGYDYGSSTTDTTTAAGPAFRRDWTNTYHQSLAYGVTDRLSVNLGMNYVTDHDRSTSAAGVVSGAGRGGFDNPSFGAAYRVIDQTDHPFSLDLRASYAPDVFPAKTPVGASDGTVASGGAQADVGLALGHQTRMFTVQAMVSGRWFGGADERDMATGDTLHTSSTWVPTLGLATQTRITPRLSVNVGGNYNFEGSPAVTNEANGVFYQSRRGDNGDLAVAVNYHIIPNRVVGSLGYTHTFYGRSDNVFPADPARDSLFDRSANTFGGTLQYVFR